MASSSITDLKWVRALDSLLYALDEKPQFASPDFPLKELERALSQTFERDLHLQTNSLGFIAKEELLNGLGEKPQILEVFLAPNPHPLYFVAGEQDLKELGSVVLGGSNQFLQKPYYQAVTQFFALEVLTKLNALGFTQSFTARLGSWLNEVPAAPYFALNVSLEIGGKKFWGRLLISDGFRNVWKSHFYSLPKSISKEKAEKIPVELALIGGKTQLSQREWKKAREGDVILLDISSLDVGKVTLEVSQEVLFRGKILDDGIKILEYPLYEEVMGKMENESDENLYGDLDEDEDDSFLSHAEEEEELPPLPFEKREEKTVSKEPPLEKIPVQLTIEVGRVGMNLSDLMNLAPGNVIDIKVEPERGVDLVVNGKKVGRGELVKLGSVLGVRILEL